MAQTYNPMGLPDALDLARSNSIAQPNRRWYVYPVKRSDSAYNSHVPATFKPDNNTGVPVALYVNGKRMQITEVSC